MKDEKKAPAGEGTPPEAMVKDHEDTSIVSQTGANCKGVMRIG